MHRHIVQEKISVSVVVKMRPLLYEIAEKIFSILVIISVLNSRNIFNFLVANTCLATELGFFVSLFILKIY